MTTCTWTRREVRDVLVLSALFTATGVFAGPNLLSNGSFELPVLTPGTDYLVAPVGGSAIPGWAVVGAPGKNVAVIEALYNLPDAAGINFAAADGVQWIDMAGAGANATEGVLQSVSLVPGAYTLTFQIGNVVAAAAGLGTQSKTDLWINGSFIQSFTNSASGGGAVNWQAFSYTLAQAALRRLSSGTLTALPTT